MMEWRTVAVSVFMISLCFLVIPIRVPSSSSSNTIDDDIRLFESYIVRYNKSYRHDPIEYDKRFKHFQISLRGIEKMNKLRTSKESAYFGATEYSDLSEDEFLKLALRKDISNRAERHRIDRFMRQKNYSPEGNLIRYERAIRIPPRLDWRTKGVVTPVKSQGNCGACWAYSTVECIESMIAIKNHTLTSYSVQEMIDCAGNNNFGCEGGDICSLLSWLVDNQISILSESLYPVTGKTDTCTLERSPKSSVRVTDFTCDSFVNAEEQLLDVLVNHGPVAAAVNALSWQNYLGGIIQFHCDSSFKMLNHAVQIVGYDNTGKIPYYIVRNSWGPLFGNDGYLYIAIGNNLCGIANQVSSLNAIW
ncbi:cathepsin O [Microplitis demolitor]|uniref:cathepsin O n=1 Tax=Microplitis demolitor TaxID=69319 RepID=UPI0004CD1771|nr:cathepsin O [Microplitis demolitor]